MSDARSSDALCSSRKEASQVTRRIPVRAHSAVYMVQLPLAEARHLAGVGTYGWPASPEAACLHAVREWLAGIKVRASVTVPVSAVVADLELILSRVPPVRAPCRGPFAPRPGTGRPPGQVQYMGGGVVRLDEDAVSTLAGLGADEDFRVLATDCGPVLTIGKDRYLAREE